MIGRSSGEIRSSRNDIQSKCTRKQWLLAQQFADAFWRRWLREYLPTLASRKKWHNDEEPLNVGDIVLILDNNIERNAWRKGVITRIFTATDEQVRIADVKTAYGPFTRPTRKLIRFVKVQNS